MKTHAQNRFLRRLANRTHIDRGVGARGEPIPGALTPVEIAHKARRRARRLAVHTQNLKRIPGEIDSINAKLVTIECVEPKDAKAKLEKKERVTYLTFTRMNLERQLFHSKQIAEKLTT